MLPETAFIVPAVGPSRVFSNRPLKSTASRYIATPNHTVAFPNSPVARSLQSYRSGERFSPSKRRPRPSPDESRVEGNNLDLEVSSPLPDERSITQQDDVLEAVDTEPKVNGPESSSDSPKSSKGAQISLLKALVRLKVASEDTCSFLIRNGYVSVNEVVAEDGHARVDCTNDKITVKGQEIGTVSNATPPVIDENDRKSIPKPQRSRSPKKVEDIMQNHRSIDGGFYARRRRMYGK